MLSTRPNPLDQNAHVVAMVQNKYAQGAYKPLKREFAESKP